MQHLSKITSDVGNFLEWKWHIKQKCKKSYYFIQILLINDENTLYKLCQNDFFPFFSFVAREISKNYKVLLFVLKIKNICYAWKLHRLSGFHLNLK